MANARKFAISTLVAVTLPAFAQFPAATPAAPQAAASTAEPATAVDKHLAAMRRMHEAMAAARTPQERQALMADQMKLMQEGMAMMGGAGSGGMGMTGPGGSAPGAMGSGGMGPGGMMGPGRATGPGAMMGPGGAGAPAASAADIAARQQWMAKHIEMMQAMMQLMVDRMQAQPPAAR